MAKSIILPDVYSAVICIALLSAYMAVYFFGADTVAAKLELKIIEIDKRTEARVSSLIVELEEIKRLQSQVALAQGIRPGFGTR